MSSCDAISMICGATASTGCGSGRLAGYLIRIFLSLIETGTRASLDGQAQANRGGV